MCCMCVWARGQSIAFNQYQRNTQIWTEQKAENPSSIEINLKFNYTLSLERSRILFKFYVCVYQ